MTLPMMVLAVVLSPDPMPSPQAAQPVQPSAPAASASAQPYIDTGLAAFKRRRFSRAAEEFRKALAADPGSAAATFYLAYTIYKIAEPKRPFHPEKQQAAEMFAKAYEMDPQFRPVWAPRR